MPGRRTPRGFFRLALTFLLLTLFTSVLALLATSCTPIEQPVYIDVPAELGSRIEDILRAAPLPRGFARSAEPLARLRVSLVEEQPTTVGSDAASETAVCGLRWLAAALPLADRRFDIGADETPSLGLRDLADIAPPLRAVRIEGRWPGEPAYRFRSTLLLRALARKGRLPPSLSAWIRSAAARARERDAAPIVLSATGDLETGAGEAPKLLQGERGFAALFGTELLARLRSSDILVGNLEGQITSGGSPSALKRFHFRFPPGTAAAYRALGFDLLLLANNHALDYGEEGLVDTLADLAAAGLPVVGAGKDESEALTWHEALGPASRGIVFVGLGAFPVESQGFSIGQAAAGPAKPGINTDLEGTLTAIAGARAQGAFVVCLVHGGTEFSDSPNPGTRQLFRRLAEAGASLVLGSHPHVLQGVEADGSSLLAYSLGNFLFTGREMPPPSRKSALLSFLVYRGKPRGFDLYPVIVTASGTRPDPEPKQALAEFSALCAALNGKIP